MLEILTKIDDAIKSCNRCGLHATRTNPVCWGGNAAAKIMIVGEAPGKDEDEQGVPFVGKSGQLLERLLKEANLNRDSVFIANLLKCRPTGNRDPEPDELKLCLPYLEQQIAIVNPRIILTLGRFPGCRLSLQFTAMGALARRTDLVHELPSREFLGIPDYIKIPEGPIPLLAAYHRKFPFRLT